MLLAVRISSYGSTWEVWRALKKLELHSAIASWNSYASFVLWLPACTHTMTRFIRLWNSPQEGSFNFRCPCKNLIRIKLKATNLSWLVYFASLMEDELRRKTDTICITMRSRANFRHESGAFVGKSIFTLWTLACQTKVISYAVSVTKWFYRQI